jgi:hypothetical protein
MKRWNGLVEDYIRLQTYRAKCKRKAKEMLENI